MQRPRDKKEHGMSEENRVIMTLETQNAKED